MSDDQAKAKILVVDDDVNSASILRMLLDEEYDMAFAISGEEALVQVASFHPDMILLDVMMSGMEGYDVIEKLKGQAATRDIGVIFVTGRTETEDVARGMALGALDYFAKPLQRPALIKARIKNHMDRIYTQRRLAQEMVRDLKAVQSRLAISALLETSLEPLPLATQLTVALDIILTIPWLAVEYQGSIHLMNPNTGLLDLVAQRNLSEQFLISCAHLKLGECLCGLAALRRETIFRNNLDHDHTHGFAGMHAHGHYCTPILYHDTLLGVLNLYVASGHVRSPEEDALMATLANTLAGIIRHRSTEKALQEERIFISTILDSTSALVKVLDPTGLIVRCNSACELLTGYVAGEICGKPFWDLAWTPEEDVEKLRETVLTTAHNPAKVTLESPLLTKSGESRFISWTFTFLHDEAGGLKNFIATGIDVTERLQAEKRLERLAHHDALTGLPNRRLFTEFLQKALARSRRHNHALAVMFMDLDHFKAVNDSHGHDVGDLLLIEASQRIRGGLRANDVVARMGGDEFTIILSDDPLDPVSIGIVAQKIIDNLQVPFYLRGQMCHIGASIGISRFPEDGDLIEDLLKKADMALYAVKKGGRNFYLLYHDKI
ncbi:MAG: diguanylate cyclase [Magnetococcus sp. YQC-5]